MRAAIRMPKTGWICSAVKKSPCLPNGSRGTPVVAVLRMVEGHLHETAERNRTVARGSRRPEARPRASRALLPVLRRLDEHLHQVIVHAIVEVTLEGPGELRSARCRGREPARSRYAVPGAGPSVRSPVRPFRSVRARRSRAAHVRSGGSPPAPFPEGSRTYASVKNDGAASHCPGQAQFRSRRVHFHHARGGAGDAGSRTGGVHAGRHGQRRSADSRAAAAGQPGERRLAIPLDGLGRRC